jgi:hypothetical protein
MAEMMALIWVSYQCGSCAADWHDGQITSGGRNRVKDFLVIPGRIEDASRESIAPQNMRSDGFSDVQLHIKALSFHSRPGMTKYPD